MKNVKLAISLIIFLSLSFNIFGQESRKIVVLLTGNWNEIVYDEVLNHSNGASLGIDVLLNNKTHFSPIFQLNYSVFNISKKFLLAGLDGSPVETMDNAPFIFLGVAYHPIKRLNISFSPGVSIFKSKAHLALNPGLDFYLDKKQRFLASASFTNIYFNETNRKSSEGFISLGMAVRLY
jgi:hypothetical protein